MAHQGKTLKKLIKQSGMTQREYAEKVGVVLSVITERFYYDKLNEKHIEEAVRILGVPKEAFESVDDHPIQSMDENQKDRLINDLSRKVMDMTDEMVRLAKENGYLRGKLDTGMNFPLVAEDGK